MDKRVTQIDIIEYLATHPTATHGEIMRTLHDDRGNLSRKLQALAKNGLIYSMGTRDHAQGEPGDLWGLSSQGLGEYIIQNDYSVQKMRQVFYVYRETYPDMYNLIKGIDEELGSNNDFLGPFTRNLAILYNAGRPFSEAFAMLNGLIRSKLTKSQHKRIVKNMGYDL